MEHVNLGLIRRQLFLPQTGTPTTWEDAAKKKLEFEKAIRDVDKILKELAKAREALDDKGHAYYHAIPMTDGTIYDECPFSRRRTDRHMARGLYKLSEKLFRWLAPKTYISVTEIKPFAEEMLAAAGWGMKMKVVDDKVKTENKPKIGQEAEDIF